MSNHFDVIIVGAGPGGIAAAVTSGEASSERSVLLIDDNPSAGGQIWRHSGSPPKGALVWLERLAKLSNVVRWYGSRVVAVVGEKRLLVDTSGGSVAEDGLGRGCMGETPMPRTVTYGSLILATGARERFVAFPGWTLPGVVGAGALQALVKSGLEVRGKRVILAGTGPLLLAVADLCVEKGAAVPLLVEQARWGALLGLMPTLLQHPGKAMQGMGYKWRLRGTRFAMDSYVMRVEREGEELAVTVKVGGGEETHRCDVLACGFHLIPNTELAQALGCELTGEGFVNTNPALQTSAENVFAVGELTGIGGVEKAVTEGRWAGASAGGNARAAGTLSRSEYRPPSPSGGGFDARPSNAMDGGASRRNGRQAAFARALSKAFALRPELSKLANDDTVVCRCEDVRLGEVRGCSSGRDAKLMGRCGMGACQGRVCGPILRQALGFEAPGVRAPVFPTTIGTLAAVPSAPQARRGNPEMRAG